MVRQSLAGLTQITGGCACGTVRYESSVVPCEVHFCHCRMCQKALGNVFGVFGSIPRNSLRFTTGVPATYRSSPHAERGFCPTCGTPLSFRYLKSDWIAIAIGTLDQPDQVRPEAHWGIESQIPWVRICDALPCKRIDGDPEYAAMLSP